jgi:hypothetical protein
VQSPEYGSPEWLEALDFPVEERAEVKRNRAKALRLGMGKPDAEKFPPGIGGLSIGPRGGVKRGSTYLGRRR